MARLLPDLAPEFLQRTRDKRFESHGQPSEHRNISLRVMYIMLNEVLC